MRLVHGLVFTTEEITEEEIKNTEFTDLTFGDYITHILIDEDKQTIILYGDNIHNPIEAEIESFVDGLRYAGIEIEVRHGVFFAEDYKKENLKFAKFFRKPIDKTPKL